MVKRLALPCLALLLIADAVQSQDPQRARMGLRGGDVVLDFAIEFWGPPPASPWSYVALVRRDDVQAELKLSDQQQTDIRKMRALYRRDVSPQDAWTMEPTHSRVRPILPRKEVSNENEVVQQFRQAQERERMVRTELGKVLNGAQMTRVGEISIQVRGTGAFTDPEVAATLGLTDAQKAAISQTHREFAQRPEPRDNDLQFHEEREARILDHLTDEQKQKFDAMKASSSSFSGEGLNRPTT